MIVGGRMATCCSNVDERVPVWKMIVNQCVVSAPLEIFYDPVHKAVNCISLYICHRTSTCTKLPSAQPVVLRKCMYPLLLAPTRSP